VEKNPPEKRIDITKRLGMPSSTLNTIIAKKKEIREQADKCGTSAKKRKTDKVSTCIKLENGLVPSGQSIRHSCGWKHSAGEILQSSCNNVDCELFSFEQLDLLLQATPWPGIQEIG
jgi:hypothetical protein